MEISARILHFQCPDNGENICVHNGHGRWVVTTDDTDAIATEFARSVLSLLRTRRVAVDDLAGVESALRYLGVPRSDINWD